jgi:hypothetical protein
VRDSIELIRRRYAANSIIPRLTRTVFRKKLEKNNKYSARVRSQKRQRCSTPNVCFLKIAAGQRARIRHTQFGARSISLKAIALDGALRATPTSRTNGHARALVGVLPASP